MGVRQFANSLDIIRRAEDSSRGLALLRHIRWQGRKLMRRGEVRLQLSQSIITDDELGGVISMVNLLGRYDHNNMHLLQFLLRNVPGGVAPVFVDVGANIGAYTLIASEVSAATVVSLEPIPAAYEKLRNNVRLNGRSQVLMLQVAAGQETGELRMTANGASALNRVVAHEGDHENVAVVPADTLDAICGRLALRPAVIKIDVEGHEPAVLAGAPNCLATCHACMVENGDRPEVAALMRQHGMSGPFHYLHRLQRLQRRPQTLLEDQIYIGPNFASAYPQITIEPSE